MVDQQTIPATVPLLLHIFSVSHSAGGFGVCAVPPPKAINRRRLANTWCSCRNGDKLLIEMKDWPPYNLVQFEHHLGVI